MEKVQCFSVLVCRMKGYIFSDYYMGIEWGHHYMILVSSSGGEPSLERWKHTFKVERQIHFKHSSNYQSILKENESKIIRQFSV